MNTRIRTIFLADALAALLAAAALLALPGFAFGEGEGPKGDDAAAELHLDGLPQQEQERIRDAAARLIRIRRTVGDVGGGEAGRYLSGVEELARFLKRGTVEEMRRLTGEADQALDLVDREWIDRTFRAVRDDSREDAPIRAAMVGRLAEQKAALRRVGDLIRQAQAIPARQKRLETATERGYRNLIRLAEEGHHTFESIDYAPARAELEWVVHEIDQVLATHVRPAHEREEQLLALHERVLKKIGGGRGGRVIRLFREYSSKVMVIDRRVREARGESD